MPNTSINKIVAGQNKINAMYNKMKMPDQKKLQTAN